ncbi:hypothetical protein VTI74DRAFT_7126 [Chaetomium olivicolor]
MLVMVGDEESGRWLRATETSRSRTTRMAGGRALSWDEGELLHRSLPRVGPIKAITRATDSKHSRRVTPAVRAQGS